MCLCVCVLTSSPPLPPSIAFGRVVHKSVAIVVNEQRAKSQEPSARARAVANKWFHYYSFKTNQSQTRITIWCPHPKQRSQAASSSVCKQQTAPALADRHERCIIITPQLHNVQRATHKGKDAMEATTEWKKTDKLLKCEEYYMRNKKLFATEPPITRSRTPKPSNQQLFTKYNNCIVMRTSLWASWARTMFSVRMRAKNIEVICKNLNIYALCTRSVNGMRFSLKILTHTYNLN